MSDERILWINAGGTLVSRPYGDPYNPPAIVEPLPPSQSGELFFKLLEEIDPRHERVDGYSYGLDQNPDQVLGPLQTDSKETTGSHILDIAMIIHNDTMHDKFLVTMGTDDIARNAALLKQELRILGSKGKKVVVTGAMVPLSMRDEYPGEGDAAQNIQCALDYLDTMEPGVCIAARNIGTLRMECMDPEKYIKDMANSRHDLKLTLRKR